MSKIEIDINQFMDIMKTALIAASQTSGDEEVNIEPRTGESAVSPPKKRRGRPKKETITAADKSKSIPQEFLPKEQSPIITQQEIDDDEDDTNFTPREPLRKGQKQNPAFIANAKGESFDRKIKAKTKVFEPPTGPNLFDVNGWGNLKRNDNRYVSGPKVGQEIDYGESTALLEGPRPPVIPVKVRCDYCGKKFETSPFLVKPKLGDRGEEARPYQYCDDCTAKPN